MQKNRFLRIAFVLVVIMAITLMLTSVAVATGDTTKPVVTNVVPADGSTMYSNGAGTIYYQSGNTTPLVIRADYSDEPGGSGIDPTSVMVHLDIGNMLFTCAATASHVDCTAAAADLFPGTHPIDVYVSDVDGNETINRTYVTVAVDSAVPTYSNLAPANSSTILTSQLNSASTNDPSALRFDYDIADAAPSSGYSPMSHVNDTSPPSVTGAMISSTSCVKTPTSVNPTHYSCQVNRAKLLHLGDNTLRVFLKDNVGNSNYSDPTSNENHYTVVDDVDPVVSGVTANPTTITAAYVDPEPVGRPTGAATLASGINTATAMIDVDGSTIMMGCDAQAGGISCPTPSGLSAGDHLVEVMVTDNAGNEGMGTGTLTICIPTKPNLGLTRGAVKWDSYTDYTAGLLTVKLIITNNGTDTAYGVTFEGSTINNIGVTLSTVPPWNLSDLIAGASVEFPVMYHVPSGVGSFMTSITASATDACGSSYTYP